MPEGDTLFKLAAELSPRLEGKRVVGFELPRRDFVPSGVVGATVTRVESLGKYLFIHFSVELALVVHLKMLGAVRMVTFERAARIDGGEVSAKLELEDGPIVVVLRAPIARVVRTRDLAAIARELGPDVLGAGFNAKQAAAALRARNDIPIGVAIMDQSALAGVGNVYKSEVLFSTGLDPLAPVSAYTDDEIMHLVTHTEIVMTANVQPGGHPASKSFVPTRAHAYQRLTRDPSATGQQAPHAVYMRSGKPCFRCGTVVAAIPQGEQQRVTYYCPTCQPSRSGTRAGDKSPSAVRARREANKPPSLVFVPPGGWRAFPAHNALLRALGEHMNESEWTKTTPTPTMAAWSRRTHSQDTLFVAYEDRDALRVVELAIEGHRAAEVASLLAAAFDLVAKPLPR